MTRKEFIKMLQKRDEENISLAENVEDAKNIENGDAIAFSFTPALEGVNGRLYIVQGAQETG